MMVVHHYWPDEQTAEYDQLLWRVLIVGDANPDFDARGAELRAHDPAPERIHLHNGWYRFAEPGGDVVMVVRNGRQPRPAEQVTSEIGPDHWLLTSRQWMRSYWEVAQPSAGRPQFEVGSTVRIAPGGEFVQVRTVHRLPDGYVYEVMTQRGRREIPEEGLELCPLDLTDPNDWLDLPSATAERFATHLTVTKLANPLTDTIYSFQSSKTVMQPYQFKPVLKLLNSSHQRLLIADEVGLGKTIEAGLVWSELEARQQGLRRVLVVCPSNLTHKWQDEMRRRFDRRVPILRQSDLDDFVERLSDDENAELVGVVSLERLRSSRRLEELNDLHPHFDLIIVDEAHYLRNRATKSYDLGEVLSSWASTLLFLSATPLNLGADDLFNLLNLLVPEEFADKAVFPKQLEPNRHINQAAADLVASRREPQRVWDRLQEVHSCELGGVLTSRREWSRLGEVLQSKRELTLAETAEVQRLLQELNVLSSVVTRTRKVDVPNAKALRSPHSISIQWTEPEARLYLAIRSWAESRARRSGVTPGFATQMPLRQAASCLPAAIELINDRDPSVLRPSEDDDFDDLAPSEDEAKDDASDPGEALAEVRRAVDGLVAESSGVVDSKFDGFVNEFLKKNLCDGQQVLLFSFFRRTLRYLHSRLTDEGFTCEVLDGSVPMEDRPAIMQRFRNGEFQILLCSEVGSEGLDFEFCDVLVNYDLPWNPMRVEQRIGRLDRFGQEHELITILNFSVPGTIETDIFERLYSRIRVFEQSIGELEPILRDEFTEITKVAVSPELSPEQRASRLEQIEIAVELRRGQLDDLDEAQSYLAGLDKLMIDGFEHDTTSRGRYVGPNELRHLLDEFLAIIGSPALMPVPDRPERAHLVGSVALGDQVARLGPSAQGSNYSVDRLSRMLRDGDPLVVTFSNEDASRSDVELISLRHPIVRAAVRYLSSMTEAPVRLGSVLVDGLPDPSHSYLSLLCLAEASGLKRSLELWPVTLDLDTDEFTEAAGDALLAATARNAIATGPQPDADRLRPSLHRLLNEMRRRNSAEQKVRAADNDALVDARLATRRAGIRHRLRRSEELLERYVREGRGQSIKRLQEGMIRNLERDLELLPGQMEQFRGFSLTIDPIAVVLVNGGAGGRTT